MIDEIGWSKLKPYDHTTYRSFEELCYCIAKNLYGHRGQFTSLDDSGGGDGVEFYLTFPNGEQWGWQAKFYYPLSRLKESNRKANIAQSLRVACRNHPSLTQWFLCTPTNFTTEEQRWFDQKLSSFVPPDRQVQIVHWGESDFLNWLGIPDFTGIRNYFFGDLELSLDWFRTRVISQIADADRKYLPQLYTETSIDAVVHALLGDACFLHYLSHQLTKLEHSIEMYSQAFKEVEGYFITKGAQEGQAPYTEALAAASNLQRSFEVALADLQQACQRVDERRIDQVQQVSWHALKASLEEALSAFDAGQAPIFKSLKSESHAKSETQEQPGRRDMLQRVYQFSWAAYSARDIFYEVLAFCARIKQVDFHIVGPAGIGKTHLACHTCDERLRDNVPALLIAGRSFTGERPLRQQLLSLLDIPSTYSWNDFLHALATAASLYRTRIPLIIDSLHEATANGLLSRIWELELAGLIQEVASTPGLVLITTCRATYTDAIWPGGPPEHMGVLEGFHSDVVESAVEKYFSWYHIKADLTASSLAQFQHPLYLKIFCESKNAARRIEKQVYVGEHTLFEVFDDYLSACNQSVCKQLGLHHRVPVVLPALEAVAHYIWRHHSRSIPLKDFVLVVDQQPLETLDWQRSRSRILLNEGLLMCRDWSEGEEVVSFTYDLLGGYLIARALLQQAPGEVVEFVQSAPATASLFCDDYRTLHPLHEDIRRCFAALLPLRTNQYLHDILPQNKVAFATSIAALFEVKPEVVNEACVRLVGKLFRQVQNRKPLLEMAMSTVGHVGHPLNMPFWAGLLKTLSLPERDLSWTESVREHAGEIEKRITRFEIAWQTQAALSPTAEARLHLEAVYIMWMLASTIHRLRNLATRAVLRDGTAGAGVERSLYFRADARSDLRCGDGSAVRLRRSLLREGDSSSVWTRALRSALPIRCPLHHNAFARPRLCQEDDSDCVAAPPCVADRRGIPANYATLYRRRYQSMG